MARSSRDTHKLQSSVRALQNDLASVLEDLEAIATNGKNVGLEKAKAQLDAIQEQLSGLVSHTVGTAAQQSRDTLDRSLAGHPLTTLAAAFAVGVAAASLFMRR